MFHIGNYESSKHRQPSQFSRFFITSQTKQKQKSNTPYIPVAELEIELRFVPRIQFNYTLLYYFSSLLKTL